MRELGYRPASVETMLKDCIDWMVAENLITQGRLPATNGCRLRDGTGTPGNGKSAEHSAHNPIVQTRRHQPAHASAEAERPGQIDVGPFTVDCCHDRRSGSRRRKRSPRASCFGPHHAIDLIEQRGLHIAGEHRRDGDPPLPELRSKAFQIGRRLPPCSRNRPVRTGCAQACHARYADNVAASPLKHRRQNRLDDIDHAEKIDAHDFLELNDL